MQPTIAPPTLPSSSSSPSSSTLSPAVDAVKTSIVLARAADCISQFRLCREFCRINSAVHRRHVRTVLLPMDMNHAVKLLGPCRSSDSISPSMTSTATLGTGRLHSADLLDPFDDHTLADFFCSITTNPTNRIKEVVAVHDIFPRILGAIVRTHRHRRWDSHYLLLQAFCNFLTRPDNVRVHALRANVLPIMTMLIPTATLDQLQIIMQSICNLLPSLGLWPEQQTVKLVQTLADLSLVHDHTDPTLVTATTAFATTTTTTAFANTATIANEPEVEDNTSIFLRSDEKQSHVGDTDTSDPPNPSSSSSPSSLSSSLDSPKSTRKSSRKKDDDDANDDDDKDDDDKEVEESRVPMTSEQAQIKLQLQAIFRLIGTFVHRIAIDKPALIVHHAQGLVQRFLVDVVAQINQPKQVQSMAWMTILSLFKANPEFIDVLVRHTNLLLVVARQLPLIHLPHVLECAASLTSGSPHLVAAMFDPVNQEFLPQLVSALVLRISNNIFVGLPTGTELSLLNRWATLLCQHQPPFHEQRFFVWLRDNYRMVSPSQVVTEWTAAQLKAV